MIIVVVVAALVYVGGERGNAGAEGDLIFTVPTGASAWSIAFQLRDEGLINSPKRFVYHLRFRRLTDKMRSGTYKIPRSASMSAIATHLSSGVEAMATVTFPEGWTSRQMAGELNKLGICDSLEFVRTLSDSSLKAETGFNVESFEGFLFPETYKFRYIEDPLVIIQEMVNVFRARVGQDWINNAKNHDLGLAGVVTLASIVQGEYQLESEAPDIAALYSNRLARNMKLQADPTIQYILPEGPRRLLLKDLKIDSPYNTYKYKGLPPGPIGNPGLVALNAALNPPERPWIFMVATGDGGHAFTENYQDHQREKAKFDRYRRQVAREKRMNGNNK